MSTGSTPTSSSTARSPPAARPARRRGRPSNASRSRCAAPEPRLRGARRLGDPLDQRRVQHRFLRPEPPRARREPHRVAPCRQRAGHRRRGPRAERRAEALVAPLVRVERRPHRGILGQGRRPRQRAVVAERRIEPRPCPRHPLRQRLDPPLPREVEEREGGHQPHPGEGQPIEVREVGGDRLRLGATAGGGNREQRRVAVDQAPAQPRHRECAAGGAGAAAEIERHRLRDPQR